MVRSDALHVAIDFWCTPDTDHPGLTSTDLIDRIALAPEPRWLPMFRFCGGVLRWAVPVGPRTIATLSIFASGEGMRASSESARTTTARISTSPRARARVISHATGPLIDLFSHGSNANSTLRVLEREGRGQLIDMPDSRFLTMVRLRYRFDGDPLPNGAFLRDIPPDDRFAQYQRAMAPTIAPHLNQHSLVGCWRADTCLDSFTGIGIYASACEMEAGWQIFLRPGSDVLSLCRNIECIDRVAGPVTDLMLAGVEPPVFGRTAI